MSRNDDKIIIFLNNSPETQPHAVVFHLVSMITLYFKQGVFTNANTVAYETGEGGWGAPIPPPQFYMQQYYKLMQY